MRNIKVILDIITGCLQAVVTDNEITHMLFLSSEEPSVKIVRTYIVNNYMNYLDLSSMQINVPITDIEDTEDFIEYIDRIYGDADAEKLARDEYTNTKQTMLKRLSNVIKQESNTNNDNTTNNNDNTNTNNKDNIKENIIKDTKKILQENQEEVEMATSHEEVSEISLRTSKKLERLSATYEEYMTPKEIKNVINRELMIRHQITRSLSKQAIKEGDIDIELTIKGENNSKEIIKVKNKDKKAILKAITELV
jgi:hypothetical protein